MKKVLISIICVLLAVALGLGGFIFWKTINKPAPVIIPSGDEIIEKSLSELAVVRSTVLKTDAKGTHKYINATYPSIQSFKNKDFQNYVNNQIASVILSYQREIDAMVDDQTPLTTLYEYVTSFEKYMHGDYLSLVISNDYQTGGIRSNKWKDIYNIDVRDERIFYLKDIFPANVDFEKEIISRITSEAESKNYDLMNGLGVKDLPEKQKFYIKDSKLIIYFDPSEIAPASYGILQFEMPFTLGEDGLFHI